MKYKKVALLVAVAGMVVPFTGCGGGGGGLIGTPTSTPTTVPTTSGTAAPTPAGTSTPTPIPTGTQRFAGQYTGAYVAIASLTGSDVSGTFTGTAASNGAITGTIRQDIGITAPGTGSVNSAGVVKLNASGTVLVPASAAASAVVSPLARVEATGPVPRLTTTPVPAATLFAPTPTPKPISVSYSTNIDGTATINNSDSVILGTLLTTQSNGNNPRGRFVGIRNMATPSVYAGTYSGSTNAAITSTGVKIPARLSFTVSTNGLIRGTYSRTTSGVRARPLIGTIDASGKATFIALAEEENPVGSGTYTLIVTTLTGQGATTGGVKISGALNRTGTSAVQATGTFTATRTSTSTG